MTAIDLKKEQEATLGRPCRNYGSFAKFLFWSMDQLHGKKLTLQKVRLLELLARIPYQAWEFRQYGRLNRLFSDARQVDACEDLIKWGRAAQDNEFWHLQTIAIKMEQDRVELNWFRDVLVPPVATFKYMVFCKILAFFNIEAAFKLNADFEDHAEHEYMQFVKDHPELENQPVNSDVAGRNGELQSWADVFRQIGLDERDHMNESLMRCGRGNEAVVYAANEKA